MTIAVDLGRKATKTNQKVDFEKNQQTTKKDEKFLRMQKVMLSNCDLSLFIFCDFFPLLSTFPSELLAEN